MSKLKTPKFWYENKTPSFFLRFVGFLYNILSCIYRFFQTSKRQAKPVVCIGNITMGGSGKTPVAIAVAEILKDMGVLPHFLSKGYGGSLKNAVLVRPNKHSFSDTGDEPLLLARHFPCWVSKNRKKGVVAAIEGGAGSIIMDDGFQNFSVYKDMSLLVIDSVLGFGNECIFPAGPLRENIEAGLKRSDACVILNATEKRKQYWNDYLINHGFEKSVFYANIVPKNTFEGKRVIGFAGIGIPNKFKFTLQNSGADLQGFFEFADHHPYMDKEIENMIEIAEKKDALLVTTEKDLVRINQGLRHKIETCSIVLQWEDINSITAFLKKTLVV